MKVWKFLWGQKGRKPSVNQLDHETIAKDKETGTLYLLTESSGGAKAVIEINGSAPGASDAHLRAHQIDSVDDHPAVPEEKRGKWAHTNAVTGEIELVDLPDLGNNLDIFAADDPFFPVLQHLYKRDGEAPAELVTIMQKPQALVWGGIVTWVEEMDFSVSRAIYYIIGEAHYAPDSVLTLAAADELLNRIDLVVANIDDTFSIITGEPGVNPVKPGINPLTQVEITQINVPAGTTGFGGIVEQVIIYNENTEWVGTGNGVTVNFDSLTDPYLGVKCADVGSIGANDTIVFVGASPLAVADYEIFSMFLKLKATIAKNESISIQFMLGATNVSAEKLLDFNKSVIDQWQNVTFKFADIFFSSLTFDTVKFIYRRPSGDHAGFYLDYIKVEEGITQPVIVSSIILAGDVIGVGVTGTPVQTTHKTVNLNPGEFGSATKIPVVTVDAKGRVTSVTEEDVTGGGEPVDLTHYCYIAWRDAPGDGFTLTPNLTAPYEAILITHEVIETPEEADFDGFWRERLNPSVIHQIPAGGTIGQVIKKTSNEDYEYDWQDDNGGGGGSTELVAIPATDQTASGITTQFTANEAQAFGDVVRINSTGKAQLAKADVIANATALALCISDAVEADATGNYMLLGFARDDAWDWIPGGEIYLSLTGTSGNTLTQTSPFAADPIVEDTVVQLLGVANTADSFYFNPQLVQVELKP